MFRQSLLTVAVIFVAIWATGTAQDGSPNADGALTLEEQAAQYKATVLLVLANRATSLPAESAPAVAVVLEEASQQLDACAAGLETHQQVWQYKVCGSAVLQQGLTALSALQAANGASPSV
uniref:Protein TsetseEP domain-containing protein n=1 Tax=Anopheles epiroticus TaxID=199890 RepID=A0A182P1N1_9DIPT